MAFWAIFLGSGTSQGVPIIGKDYPPEFLANPKNHRTRPSIYVATDKVKIVVDTTPEFRLQILRENIRWLDAVIFTHSHADHIMGLDDCRRFCDLRGGTTLPIYASMKGQWTICGVSLNMLSARITFPRATSCPTRTSSTVHLRWATWKLRAAPSAARQDNDLNGYLFVQDGKKRLAYLSDCKEVPPDAIEKVRGVEVAVLDALRREPHPTHMCLDEALTAARLESGAART